jgi:hypothetical protein
VTAYVTFKCNDELPSGMPCRGGFSVEADSGGRAIETAWKAAQGVGWTFQILRESPEGMLTTHDHCPSCTRRLAVSGG